MTLQLQFLLIEVYLICRWSRRPSMQATGRSMPGYGIILFCLLASHPVSRLGNEPVLRTLPQNQACLGLCPLAFPIPTHTSSTSSVCALVTDGINPQVSRASSYLYTVRLMPE